MDTKTNPAWMKRFPYTEPYREQRDAIDKILSNAKDGGFTVMEKACGGGKTLDALETGIELVRDPSTKYERVFALTSVKQQLRAFEDDLQSINENLPANESDVSGLTLVGKADMCSYVESGDLSDDRIYSRCNELREPVKTEMAEADGEYETEKVLQDMIGEMQVDGINQATGAVSGSDWTAPYRQMDLDAADYCAFYANYRLKQVQEKPMLDISGMMTPTDVMQQASDRGICPHAALGETLDTVDVVVANYKHAFNPITVKAFTGELLSDETYLVCDEAHTLVGNVRDELSDEMSLRTIGSAIREVENDVLNQSNEAVQKIISEELSSENLTPADVEVFRDFLTDLEQKVKDLAIDGLENDNSNWQDTIIDDLQDGNTIEHQLRNPKQFTPDKISVWAEQNNYGSVLEHATEIGEALGDAFQRAKDEVGYSHLETHSEPVGRVLGAWYQNDHEQYFRELILETRDRRYNDAELYWNEFYTVTLKMVNCIPFKEIANRLNEFGGGLLMSATLYPLKTFEKETGLSALREFEGRPVQRLVYGLNFPPENRGSFAVDAPKFTYKNRGSRYDDNSTRDEYSARIKDVVRNTDGNILIGMPSYEEAEWVEYALNTDSSIKKPVRADESSTVAETEDLKAWFFRGGPKVLTTSVKGTLTEGVDYDGDKLKACVVAGVPFPPTNSPATQARVAAYDSKFGDGFDMALTVPAVRKTRQALGRVIRGDDETGIRVLLDERYADQSWDSVREHLPEYEQTDYTPTSTEDLEREVMDFWRTV